MKQIVIIDDEKDARQSLVTLLNTYCPEVEICGEADSVEQAYSVICQTKPSCILLDISMEDGTGFDLLDRFPNPAFHVIFVTAYDSYALKAFRYHAIDYLLKPIQVEELVTAINRINPDSFKDYIPKIQNLLESNKTRQFDKITLTSMEGLVFINISDIIQLESSGSYTTFYLINEEKHLVARPMKDFEDLMPEKSFFKIHQSHIININLVKKVLREDGGFAIMSNGLRIPIARRRKDEFLMTMKNRFSPDAG
jgi:two-component system LytT family response regulator